MTTSILIQESNELDSEIERLEEQIAKLKSKRPTKRRVKKIALLENQVVIKKQQKQITTIKIVYNGRINEIALDTLYK